MIKRPLNTRFSDAVREGRKITTIRDNPWPIGKSIMLYNWSGKPYGSPHADVAAVIVEETTPIRIGRSDDGALIFYHVERGIHKGSLLWSAEGFLSQEDMDAWFTKTLKPGQTVEKHLMRFSLKTQP
jgi:hypothetical protein